MRTLIELFGKKQSIDVFNALRDQSLTEKEMNLVRGGGDPPPPEPEPPIIIIPYP